MCSGRAPLWVASGVAGDGGIGCKKLTVLVYEGYPCTASRGMERTADVQSWPFTARDRADLQHQGGGPADGHTGRYGARLGTSLRVYTAAAHRDGATALLGTGYR